MNAFLKTPLLVSMFFCITQNVLAEDIKTTWVMKSIQIERQVDGYWHPQALLRLDQQSLMRQSSTGGPDFEVRFVPSSATQDMVPDRLVSATCKDGAGFSAVFFAGTSAPPKSWREELRCPASGSWRLTLVDTLDASLSSGVHENFPY